MVAFLDAHPLVDDVGDPELPGHPDHELAKTLLPRGCGAVFSFNLRGTRAQGRKFIETLNLFSHLANVGDAKSLVIHPASTTHFRMSAEDLAKSGITEGTIRLSIGLEDAEDLTEDLSRALHAAPEETVVSSRWKPGRSANPLPEIPRSSSIVSTRWKPNSRATSASAYCRR